MRSALVAFAGTAVLAISLTACAGHPGAPATGQPAGKSSIAEPANGQPAAGSPTEELEQIRSTLDAIDSELAGDDSR